jgi:hypothetical protein
LTGARAEEERARLAYMVFVNTDEKDQTLGRRSSRTPAAGDDRRRGRLAFDAVPGRVFKGKVRVVPLPRNPRNSSL